MDNRRRMAVALVALLAWQGATAQKAGAEEPLTKEADGTRVVNTTTLGTKVRGFRGQTPVRIFIRKKKVVRVEALPNRESPQYMEKARAVLTKWDGMKVREARALKVDAVTGATYSSKALIRNVQLGLDYFLQHP